MKRKILSAVALLIAILCIPAAVAFAHPGRTDSSGGHYNRETGEYHYHHGYPAHQHPNGVCPYDFDDATEESSESSRPSTAQERINSALEKLEDAGYSSSSQSTTVQQASTSYQRGYDIGYKDGEADGKDAGYESGYDDGYSNGYIDAEIIHEANREKTEESLDTFWSRACFVVTFAFIIFLLLFSETRLKLKDIKRELRYWKETAQIPQNQSDTKENHYISDNYED